MNTSRILVVDDEPEIREAIRDILEDEGYQVSLAADARQARELARNGRPDLVLLDIWMEGEDGISLLKEWSKQPGGGPRVVIISGHGTVDTAVEATRLGALDFMEKPISLAKLLYVVERALKPGSPRGKRFVLPPPSLIDVIAEHPAIERLRHNLDKATGRPEPILFLGEVGTGRETLARQLARSENRPFKDWVLAGAQSAGIAQIVDNPDLYHGQALFFNELSDAGPELQAVLMRLMETNENAGYDFRVLASAAPALLQDIDQGRFRRDLYDQLATIVIPVPAVREYREFLPELIRYYTDSLADADRLPFRQFSVGAVNRFRNHAWPGNLRELRNVVQRLLLAGDDSPVSLEEVDDVLGRPEHGTGLDQALSQDWVGLSYREARDNFERSYLKAQLEVCEGKVAKVAERIGLERTHLYRKLKSLGIDISSDI